MWHTFCGTQCLSEALLLMWGVWLSLPALMFPTRLGPMPPTDVKTNLISTDEHACTYPHNED